MARIAGVDLNEKWKVDYALSNIKGVGWSRSREIMKAIKLDESKRVSDLTNKEKNAIVEQLSGYDVEGDLVRKHRTNIQRLKEIGSYRGLRHARGLPSRGQRTRSNARTKRGKRKTVGAFKKSDLAKQTSN